MKLDESEVARAMAQQNVEELRLEVSRRQSSLKKKEEWLEEYQA